MRWSAIRRPPLSQTAALILMLSSCAFAMAPRTILLASSSVRAIDLSLISIGSAARLPGGGASDIGALLGDAGLLETDAREGRDTGADVVRRRQCEADPQMRFALARIARPFGPRVEDDPGLGGWGDQFRHVDPVRQLQPQKNATLRLPHLFDRGAEFALDGLDHRFELAVQGLGQAADVLLKILREIFSNDHLVEGAGAAVGFALAGYEPAHDLRDRHRVTEAQGRRQGFRERADVDDLLRVHRIERRRARAVPGQVGVALVFEDRDTVLAGQRQQRLATFARQD